MTETLKIKICGINDKNIMKVALECKVDYIGLVFFKKSPRNLNFNVAKKILEIRNSYSKIVALTVDPDDLLISQIKKHINPDFIQLHGKETSTRCKEIKDKFCLSIIKAIGIINTKQFIKSTTEYEPVSDILLLDAPSANLPGGNGHSFNWNILKKHDFKKKWMLAGGINSNNVKEAIKTANPPIIDVSSGVETDNGIKNARLIKNFVKNCRNI